MTTETEQRSQDIAAIRAAIYQLHASLKLEAESPIHDRFSALMGMPEWSRLIGATPPAPAQQFVNKFPENQTPLHVHSQSRHPIDAMPLDRVAWLALSSIGSLTAPKDLSFNILHFGGNVEPLKIDQPIKIKAGELIMPEIMKYIVARRQAPPA